MNAVPRSVFSIAVFYLLDFGAMPLLLICTVLQ
jgi:hypothetical protein